MTTRLALAAATSLPEGVARLLRGRVPLNRTSSLLEAREGRLDTEAKRVIYVGVTRARVLLAIALPQAVADRVTAVLAASDVPYVRRNVGV